jgi:hypothetical protein
VPKLVWNTPGERYFETGVDRGVLYIDGEGHAWSGLVSVDESPSGGENRSYYLDGIKYLTLSSREEYSATVSAYYSPPAFDACDGLSEIRSGLFVANQRRKSFGFSYRTRVGNDIDSINHGYKIHIVYDAVAAPSNRSYQSISNEPEASLLTWSVITKPRVIPEASLSSHIVVDTTKASPFSVSELEDILYGTDLSAPRLPDPEEIISIFTDSSEFAVTDLGNDMFSITGSDLAVLSLGNSRYQITSDNVVPVDADRAQISS